MSAVSVIGSSTGIQAANPDSGASSVYTAKAYGPVASATVGWLWWLQLVVVIAVEALGQLACWPPSSRRCRCG